MFWFLIKGDSSNHVGLHNCKCKQEDVVVRDMFNKFVRAKHGNNDSKCEGETQPEQPHGPFHKVLNTSRTLCCYDKANCNHEHAR